MFKYTLTSRSYDGKYGIKGLDTETGRVVVTMPFHKSRLVVLAHVAVLNVRQTPIESFLWSFLNQ